MWIHLGRDIIADVPSSSSFSGVPPSFLLVIHLTRFSFLCLCLSLFLSLGRVFLSLSLPPHSALAANPFPATQSGQASRWKGAINNCIRIYDVLYGRAARVGRIRREEGRKEKLTTTLPSYFPWQITICAKSLPPSCRLSQCVGRRLFASNGTERNGNEIARAGRMSKAESQRDAAPPPLGEDPQPI